MSTIKNTINYDRNKALFQVRVNKEFIEQFVVSLALICHSSERGIVELLRDVLDYDISVGTVHNILSRAIVKAQRIQERENFTAIQVGAHDEIFQGREPILVGSCAQTSYCYLLSQEQSRDGDTWGIRLLDLQNKGLQPDCTIADGGSGLRAGQSEVWPSIPCFADIFHALRDLGRVSIYQENRAIALLGKYYDITAKMIRAKKHHTGNKLSKQIVLARVAAGNALAVADSLAILSKWMQQDVLALIGPNGEVRRMLFDFIIQELQKLELPHFPHIKKVRCKLQNQRDNLLMFADKIDQKLIAITKKFDVELLLVRKMYEVEAIAYEKKQRWFEEKKLREKLRSLYHPIQQAIEAILKSTVRASSVIENINSRLRNYFFLRKRFGQGSLDLLRFFLNHRRFMRSHHPERVGKSPAELLSEKPHMHWLELLGFTRFQQVIA